MDSNCANRQESKNKPATFEVQKIFATSGSVYVVPPNTDKNQTLSKFDHPEFLDLIDITKNVCVICRKQEHGILLSLFNGKIRRLIEMGMSLDVIDTMSFEDVIALKKNL
ncbi:MAG: hypothetical protein US74_C0016G0016 [Parcubacteria group bacterium GW2011_GWA2_38_13]|nr:MAG: hypothetical protein US74_C0016G0016 [Parcubacteria group bacterium GW2011_GWA2_38_13]